MSADPFEAMLSAVYADAMRFSPWQLDGWTVLTSGRVVAAARGVAEGTASADGQAVSTLRRLLRADDAGAAEVDVAALDAWLREHGAARVDCARCGGSGEVTARCCECEYEHKHDCTECDGEGKVTANSGALVRVAGVPTFAWRLQLMTGWLLACGVGRARAQRADTNGNVPTVLLSAGDLRAACASVTLDDESWHTAPAWGVDAAQAVSAKGAA